MSTLIEAFSEGIRRLNFSEKENLDFLNRCCAFWEVPEFHINDCYEVPFNFFRISEEGFVEFFDFPLDVLGMEGVDLIAAFAISELFEGNEIPKSLKRIWEIF